MTAQGHRIFVSHSHLDNDFGTKFAQDLRRALNDENAVWYDVLGGLHGGETWWEKIVAELTARDVFIVVLSPDAMNSSWVRQEIDIAINEGKRIIPVLHRSCSIRADLKIRQFISFLAPKTYEEAFREVLLALGLPTNTPVEQEKVTSLPSNDPATVLLQQIEAAFAAHDWPDVLRKADYLIKRMSGDTLVPVYRMQGVALLEEGEEHQAQEIFETALALVSNRELRLTLLGDSITLLAKQEQWTKVQQRAKETLRLVPNDPGWLAIQQQAQSELAKQAAVGAPSPTQTHAKEPPPSLLERSMETEAFFEQPYSNRQLIIFVEESEGNPQIGNIQKLGYWAANILYRSAMQTSRSTNEAKEQGVKNLNLVGKSKIPLFQLPPGHPRNRIVYAGHPAIPEVYVPLADFHRLTFEHKFSEVISLLMHLGARTIKVDHVTGWGKDFSSRLNVNLPSVIPSIYIGVEAKANRQNQDTLLYEAELENTQSPSLPDNLVWYPYESTWQQVANQKLKFGLKNFNLFLSYNDDYGINAGIKLKIDTAGLDAGGTFERHIATTWRIHGHF
jgi:TIR domain